VRRHPKVIASGQHILIHNKNKVGAKFMSFIDAIIVGSGFGGIGMGHILKSNGLTSFEIWEKESDIGGCWRDNHYPGASCDVPSHLYSYSFAPYHPWSRKFAPQTEIHQYIRHCAEQFNLINHIHLNRKVVHAQYDDNAGLWAVTDQNNDTVYCRFLISATGQLNEPLIPNIPGLSDFKGTLFHSARWQHNADLNNQSVGVIGTGASAIQFVPELAKKASSLTLFQRTPPYIIPKPDHLYGQFKQKLFQRLPVLQSLDRLATYLLYESRFLAFRDAKFLMIPYRWYWKRFLNSQVKDPVKRAQLTPKYNMGCKRILISNDFYKSVDQEHVQLNTQGIERVTEGGIIDGQGQHHSLDTIVLGTGFKATDFLCTLSITGKNNQTLNQYWKGNPKAYKGICVNGFPNLFMLYGPNTNLGHNSIIYMLESQFQYIVSAIQFCKKHSATINVKEENQTYYNDNIQQQLTSAVWQTNCHSWYKTENGSNPVNWSDFTFKYRRMTRHFDLSAFDTRVHTYSMGNSTS